MLSCTTWHNVALIPSCTPPFCHLLALFVSFDDLSAEDHHILPLSCSVHLALLTIQPRIAQSHPQNPVKPLWSPMCTHHMSGLAILPGTNWHELQVKASKLPVSFISWTTKRTFGSRSYQPLIKNLHQFWLVFRRQSQSHSSDVTIKEESRSC